MPKIVIAKKFVVDKRLGEGSFGKVHSGYSMKGLKVAIKFEPRKVTRPKLRSEYLILKHLQDESVGVPRLRWFGTQDDYTIMITELLGPSLDDLIKSRKRFSLKTTLMIGLQMLNLTSYVHSKGILYRDMKPDNFLMKPVIPNELYIIDFGLSRTYKVKGKHIPQTAGNGFVGTARYASIRSHEGVTQSRRDDIESMLHVLIYFMKGRLPWQKAVGTTKEERYKNIHKIKKSVSPATLCKGLPGGFQVMLEYARNLDFEEKPGYVYLSDIMNDMMARHGITFDWEYDWS